MKFFNFLKGKKTYIVGIITIAYGIVNNDTSTIIMGLGMMTLRNAI